MTLSGLMKTPLGLKRVGCSQVNTGSCTPVCGYFFLLTSLFLMSQQRGESTQVTVTLSIQLVIYFCFNLVLLIHYYFCFNMFTQLVLDFFLLHSQHGVLNSNEKMHENKRHKKRRGIHYLFVF